MVLTTPCQGAAGTVGGGASLASQLAQLYHQQPTCTHLQTVHTIYSLLNIYTYIFHS